MDDKTWNRCVTIFAIFMCVVGLAIDFGLMPEITMNDLGAISFINCGLLFGIFAMAKKKDSDLKEDDDDGEDQEQDR